LETDTMPLELPETPGNQPSYPNGLSFAKLLEWHLNSGTRPNGSGDHLGKRWGNKEFAAKVNVDERSVRNWRAGRSHPTELSSIERELFGENGAFIQWKRDLRIAYDSNRLATPPDAAFPRATSHFLGRGGDIATIRDAMLRAPIPVAILVQGGPGIGKTTLTKAIGNHPDIVHHFGENDRWFVELEAVNSTAAMQDAIARAVGADPTRGFKATLAKLRQRPGLLVLVSVRRHLESIESVVIR
jgi:hypothetical protein